MLHACVNDFTDELSLHLLDFCRFYVFLAILLFFISIFLIQFVSIRFDNHFWILVFRWSERY